MRNQDRWSPSKYLYRAGRLSGSRDTSEVSVGSRLVTDLIASFYAAHIPEHVHGHLIDIGCGKVPLYEAYRKFITENTCVDWSGTLHKNEFLDRECDLSEPLPFADEEFDTIILSDVLEHLPDPELAWSEMARILRAHGKIFVNTPFLYCLHEAPHDYYRYTEFALRRFVERAGLNLVLLSPIGGTAEVLADITAKHLQFVPIIGRPLATAIQYLTGLFGKTPPGRLMSEKTAVAFPLGYFLIAEKPA